MTEKQIYERLESVFTDIFDEEIKLSAETTAEDVEDWDSLTHISLISAVEAEFGVRFKMKEVSAMKNVGEMVAIISERA
ncbi:MAG: acyl carrier protein [Ruminococcaceae bacterium]|nr:acyl carrier protein [Oscillospiraceae bacterium]